MRINDWLLDKGEWLLCLVIGFLIFVVGTCCSGCAGTVALYRDTPDGPRVWQISGATVGSKLPEGSNEMTATMLDDGTWELIMGGKSSGAEAAGLSPEMLQLIGRMAVGGFLPPPEALP